MFLGLAAIVPILHRQLHRHLHRHRARIAKKYGLQGLRRHRHQLLGQLHPRLVGQAAEHDMGHLGDLGLGRSVQARMAIAMDTGPPGRNPIHQPPSIFEF